MARVLGRHPRQGHPYRACTAQVQAATRAGQPRQPRTLLDPWLWRQVRTQLAAARPNRLRGASDARILTTCGHSSRSRPSIWASLYGWPRSTLRGELLAALRQARKARRPRARRTDRRGQIPTMTPITERPAEVTTRTVPGHWEGDLIKGTPNGSAIGTLVERTTRLVILAKMNGTDAPSARAGFTKKLRHLPALLRKTLTYDRGKEMVEHERLAERLAIQIFFADPYSPSRPQ